MRSTLDGRFDHAGHQSAPDRCERVGAELAIEGGNDGTDILHVVWVRVFFFFVLGSMCFFFVTNLFFAMEIFFF